MRSEMEAQQAQMQRQIVVLQQQIELLSRPVAPVQQSYVPAVASPALVEVQSTQLTQLVALTATNKNVTTLEGEIAGLEGAEAVLAATVKKNQSNSETPAVLHYKGVNLTPGGFLAGETAWRQHELQADIASPFNSIPLPGSDLYNISEFRLSAHQSRMNMLAEGKVGSTTLNGYLEFDMLGAGLTSNSTESNSYLPRLRHAFVQANWTNGWSLAGGQGWSLLVSNRKGINSFASNAYLPDMIDAQYVVGLNWARQPFIRAVKQLGNSTWFAVSAEGAQTSYAATNAPANFLYASPGTSNLTSTVNYTFDTAPDVIAKLAFEPGFGHYEIKGLASFFRDRVYPNALATPASAAGAYNNQSLGGGLGAAASWNLDKKVDFSLNALGGNGVGRYGTSTLPDVTVAPDGALRPIRGAQGLATLEFNPNKQWKIYSYGGTEYAGRKDFINAAGKGVGYGSPLNVNTGCETEMVGTGVAPVAGVCNANTRALYQGVFGLWYRPYVGTMGRVQYGLEYSYTVRTIWSGVGLTPNATENMVFTSMRYYLP
jgi:hypothetical protein